MSKTKFNKESKESRTGHRIMTETPKNRPCSFFTGFYHSLPRSQQSTPDTMGQTSGRPHPTWPTPTPTKGKSKPEGVEQPSNKGAKAHAPSEGSGDTTFPFPNAW